jgi:5-methylcytosine-specific restriction endonuclease McrA
MFGMRNVAEVHRELQAAVVQWERAEQNVVTLFAEFVHGQLYRELGYPDIHSYAREELGFSKSRTSHLLSLVLAMQKLPALQTAVQNQELAWTKAAAIARHATPESAQAWVNVAKRSTRAELRKKLKQAQRPAAAQLALEAPSATELEAAPPREALPTMTDVRLRLNPLQLQRYERALRRLGGKDRVETLLQALERASSKSEPLRRRNSPPTLLVVHECPRCRTSVSKSPRGDRKLSAAQAAAARCDATLQRNGKRRQTIPPRLRRQALERDDYRCTARGCRQTHDLQVHHLHERQHGGGHQLENLVTLCRRCHESLHRGWRSTGP